MQCAVVACCVLEDPRISGLPPIDIRLDVAG
jgi:hypothetical protein